MQNAYVLEATLETRHEIRGFRSVTIDRTKQSATWQAWKDRVRQMDALSSTSVTLLCDTETAEVKAAIDSGKRRTETNRTRTVRWLLGLPYVVALN